MTPEGETYQAALREAGQPWSRWGVRVTGVGVVGLLVAQVAPTTLTFFLLLGSTAVVAVGWGLLINAVVHRRNWARANPIGAAPVLPDVP